VAENDPEVKFSPAWWMRELTHRRGRRLEDTYNGLDVKPGVRTLNLWMENTPPLPPGAPDWLPAYQDFHRSTRTNLAEPLVRSATDRMRVLSFRTGASDDDNGDDMAARIWDQNQMMVEQVDLLTDMFSLRDGYTMIIPDPDGGEIPSITSLDPHQVYTAHDPVRKRVVRAALNTYHDPDAGIDVVWIYIRGEKPTDRAQAYRAWKPAGRNASWSSSYRYMHNAWTWDDPKPMATNRVPIVRFPNRRGKAEFEPHIGQMDRINRITLQRMLIGELQAFRQRAVKGLPERYPMDYPVPEMRGKPIDYAGVFTPGPGSLWQTPPGVEFWESQPIDLRPILEEEKHELRTYAGLAGMPVHYFNPSDTQGSAEGASLQRESLTFRIGDRKEIAAVGYAETMAHAFEIMGETQRADVSAIEPIWAPSEVLSLTEKFNAASQAKAAGMASRTIKREVLRFTPRQIKASEDDEARDRILAPRPVAPGTGLAPAFQQPGQQRNPALPVQPREQR
jgi:hypothetical protein